MRILQLRRFAGLVAGLALLAATPAVAGVQPAATTAAAGDPQSFWIHWNSTPTTDAMLAQEARRRSFILLNAWEGNLIPRLKAANPAIQVFVYKDLSSTRSYACRNGQDDAQLPTGVGYCAADASHPDWFLTNPAGQRYVYSGYAGHYQMDVGNVAYQNAWIANVTSNAKTSGFDGVLMDNALFTCDAYHDGSCPTRYPTDAAMQTAYKSFLANAQADFRAAGLKTMANLSNARLHGTVWNDYMAYLDGGWDEWWLAFSGTNLLPEYAEGWSKQLAEIEANEARGKFTLVQPHFGTADTRAFRYTFASYLMANGGRSAFTEIATTDGYGNPTPWHTEYGYNLGAATGARYSVGANLWRRNYQCGVVVVNSNATAAAAQTIQLGGSHLNQDNATVTSVRLAGTSGAVLRKPGCTPAG